MIDASVSEAPRGRRFLLLKTWRFEVDVIVERPAALDVHKAQVTPRVRVASLASTACTT